MRCILTALLLFFTTACASDTINSEIKVSQMKDNELELDVGDQKVRLEFFNIKFNTINKECMSQRLKQFNAMIQKHNYDSKKHFQRWYYGVFAPPKEPFNKKMILVTYSAEKYSLIVINNIEPKDKTEMEYYIKHRKKPSFYNLPVSPYKVTNGPSYTVLHGWSKEDIDFESCFQ